MALPNLIYFTRSHGCPYCDKFAPVMDSFITNSFPLEILKLDTCDDQNTCQTAWLFNGSQYR